MNHQGYGQNKKVFVNNSRLLVPPTNFTKASDTYFQNLPPEQLLYLIDFGISTPYIGQDGKLLPQKVMRNIRCSPQYAGLNQLNGMSLCRRDDIEAIFYTMVALLRVKLSRVSSYQKHM